MRTRQKLQRKLEATLISSLPTFKQTCTDPIYFLALGFGSGLSPKAPGTCGSLVALIIYVPLSLLPVFAYLAYILLAFMLGVYICGVAANRLDVKDPGAIVWDEFVGMWIALIIAPEGWSYLVLAFLLFRLFDIFKPWPVDYLDRNIEGGLGVMMDDVAAGIYALAVLQIIALGMRELGLVLL